MDAKPAPLDAVRRGRPPQTAEEAERVRSHILEATTEVFGEVGYHRMTVEQILKRAEIARPTFYRYFASVAEAANTVLERTDEAILTAVIAAFGEGEDLTSKITGAVDAYLAWAEGRGALLKAMYAELHDPTSPVSAHRVSVQTVLADAILEQFRLMKRKPPAPFDIDLALNTVLYAGFMLNTTDDLDRRQREHAHQSVRRVMQTLLALA